MTYRHIRLTAVAVTAAAIALAGCSSGESDETDNDQAATAEATTEEATPTCTPSLVTGEQTVSVDFDGQAYDVRVYVPEGLGEANPIVLDLHGSSSNGPLQAEVSGLDAVADEGGFIVAQPTGVLEAEAFQPLEDGAWAWNVPGVPTTAGEYPPVDARDDIEFLTAVIAELTALGCGDANQVFITGYSGGGRMASAMACARPDLVAAVAPVDGLRAGHAMSNDLTIVDPSTCQPAPEDVAIVTFHGTADVVNPYDGNDDPRWGYTVQTALEAWADLNGCDATPNAGPVADADADAVTLQSYSGCENGADVAGYIIEGGNHIWPGTSADQSFFGDTDWGINASELMWEFFSEHPKMSEN